MADFQLKVTAETQNAEKDLRRLDKTANEATKDRKIKLDVPSIGQVSKNFSDLSKNLETAANDIKKFYGVARQLPGIGAQIQTYEKAVAGTAKTANALASNTKAGEILTHSFEKATGAVGKLVNNLAKVGFALFGIKEIVGVLQTAFGGLFNQTIGREIKLRETILKTQTTLASTAKVFSNGKEITDPYQKIVSLTGAVRKNIDSIRERSVALAGVTSGEVIEVFGIVATQISQIGGGLKEAEDLAINFAAALGTFGIPLYQARQEIGSILRGDITMDSYLAKALGITNEDVAKAKTQAGGLVKFLEDRLAAAVAGQKIAAQGFSGIVSNIKDLAELLGQRFGAALLDPLLNVLAAVFENLFRIKEQIFAIADGAGQAFGRVAAIGREIRSRAGLVSLGEIGLKDDSGQKALNAIKDAVQDVTVLVEGAAQRAIGAIAQAIQTLKPSVVTVADAFVRLGKVFIEIKVDTFESLARVLANLITLATPLLATFTTLFNLYSRFLDLPVIQEFAKLAATMSLLKRAGMDFITNAILIGNTLFRVVIPAVGALGTAFGVVIGGVGAVVLALGKLTLTLAGLTAALAGVPGIAAGVAKALVDVSKNLGQSGQQSVQAGNNINTLAGGFKNLGETAKLAGLNIVKSLGWTLLIQAAVTVAINAVGEFQKASEDTARQKRAELALTRLSSVYRNVGDDADYATKAARDFEQQLTQAEYGRAIERLEEIRKKLNDMRYEAQIGIQTWGEFFRIFDLGRTIQRAQGLNPVSIDAAKLIGEEKRLRDYQRKYEADQDKRELEKNIQLQADKRVNLEKEIRDLQRQHQDELFQQRQTLAQKEVEIFRAAGELRIFQMEQANQKLIEGEEGASRAALESLNNYLSVRERGELEIESAKKNLAIEIANLDKQIADYRLDNEKKIAEIRKRAGDYEKNISDYRRQVAGQIAAGSGGGAATFGATGNVKNAPGWVHGHFQTNTGTLNDLIQDVIPVLKGLLDQGIPVELSSGVKVQGGKDDNYYKRILTSAAQQHRHSGDGRSIDLFVPQGTKVPVPLSDVSGPSGRGGISGVLPGSGKSWVGHLAPGSKAGGAAAVAPPQAPDFSSVAAPAVEKYAAAVRSVASAMERLRALQEALTQARTAAAFTEIAKAAFPQVQVEQYLDKVNESKLAMTLLSQVTEATYDPERLQLAAEYQNEINIKQREFDQIWSKALNTKGIQQQELNRLQNELNERSAKYTKDLQQQYQYKLQQLQLDRLRASLQDSLNRTKSLGESTQDIETRTRRGLEGVRAELIDAEIAKRELRRRLNEALKNANGDPGLEAQARSTFNNEAAAIDAEALAKIAANNPITGLMSQWKRELTDTKAMVASLAQTIQSELGSAMSNAVSGVINGTMTVQEAFGQMFANIGRAFIEMATQMIAKALILQVLGLFAGGAPGGGGGLSKLFGAGAPAAVAGGGIFSGAGPFQFRASGGPISAGRPYIVGERGPELVFPGADGYVLPADRTAAALAQSRAALGGGGSSAASSSAFSENRDALSSVTSMSRERQVERWLTSGAGSTEIKYSRVGSGDLPFVTEQDMLQATRIAAQEGAKLGQQRTLAALRNNPATRRSIGV